MAEKDRSISTVQTVIGMLLDGEQGFQLLGTRMREPEHRSFYLEEARVRAAFATELIRTLESVTGKPVLEHGTMLGQLHRTYTEIVAALATSDGALLNTTELCERVAVRVYEHAIVDGRMPANLLEVLTHQAGHVRMVYEMIKDFRMHARN